MLGVYLLTWQAGTNWRDPSPHQVRFVTVESSVRLEVLDWGGSGRPILFVGCYLTGHVYDDIAPKLTDQFRVYAVTRRGVGASDRPATGYDPRRRADDILEVIGGVGMQKPILIGNSCGGDILHTLGAQHPDRLGGLVYLDAAEDTTLTLADYGVAPGDLEQVLAKMPAPVGKSAPVTFPEGERRQMAERPLDPTIRKAIVEDNRVRPDYARIRVPVLAIYRSETIEQTLKDYPPTNEEQRAALNQAYAANGRGCRNGSATYSPVFRLRGSSSCLEPICSCSSRTKPTSFVKCERSRSHYSREIDLRLPAPRQITCQ